MEISSFKFDTPMLKKLEFLENPNFNIEGNLEVESNFEIEIDKIDNFEAVVTLNLSLNNKENLKEQNPFFLNISMSSIFNWEDVEDEEVVDTLLSQNAPALIIGFLRPIVSNITNASVFPPYNIPFIDFTK